MQHSVTELIEIAHRHYPRGISREDPRYDTSEEHLRLVAARRKAGEQRGPWCAMLQRMRERFPGNQVYDWVECCPGESLQAVYSCAMKISPASGERERRVALMMSFLIPYYAVYSEHYEDDPEPVPGTTPEYICVRIGTTFWFVPPNVVTPGLREALRDEEEGGTETPPTTRCEKRFELSPDEQPYATWMVRSIEDGFGYQYMSPEIGNVIVPEVETDYQRFGEATLYGCLLSDP